MNALRLWSIVLLALCLIACRSQEAREERRADGEARREELRAARQEVRKEQLAARRAEREACRSAPQGGTRAAPAVARPPQAGDSWTYCLAYLERRGVPPQPFQRHVVTVASASESEVIDELVIEGGSPSQTRHERGGYLVSQPVSVFSPYLAVFDDLSARRDLGRVELLDAPCKTAFLCEARAQHSGTETVTVPAGTFDAIKIVVTQTWRPADQPDPRGMGDRTLVVWYAPQLKRAVKYESRTSRDAKPLDPSFDLELVTYALK